MQIDAVMSTTKGDINLTLHADQTPLTVSSFANLAARGFYDGLSFHRVINNFMVQGGCPLGSGTGNPGYRFEDEFDAALKHDGPGVLSMANSGPATNGSQFFITHGPQPHLNGAHTVFGKVKAASDQAVVDSIAQGDKINSLTISGDVDSLLANYADRISEWNEAISKNFPHLA